jgi:type I restriction enzyme, S subunit
MSDKLPQGWTIAPLSKVAELNPRHPKGLDDSLPISFARMAALSETKPEFESLEQRTLGEVRKGFTHFAEGDVLFAKITPCMENGKGAVARGLRNQLGCGTTELHVIRPLGHISPEYIYRFLAQDRVRRAAKENFTGTAGQARVPKTFIEELEMPLAPLAEQRRIVAKLTELLGKVDACQQRLAKIPVLLKRFRQSVLAAACSGRLTADWREENPNVEDASWLVAELERIHKAAGGHKKGNAAPPSDEAHDLSAEDLPPTWRLTEMRSVVCPDRPITYGILKPGPETPGGIPYVRVADFPNDQLNLQTIRRTTKDIEKTFARARLRAGDILLSIRGTVGRVCVVPHELENANITQDTARLSIQPSLEVGFVKWFLRAAPTQKRMQKAVRGVAVRGINIGDVRALQMPVPPLREQQEIVRRVAELFKVADQIESRFAHARAQVDKLTPSLLARAFRGQLVPQDPTDEPGEKLLERIKIRRA